MAKCGSILLTRSLEEFSMFKTTALIVCDDERFCNACSQILFEENIKVTNFGIKSENVINAIINTSPNFVVIDAYSVSEGAVEIVKSINLSPMSKKPMFLVGNCTENEYERQEFKNAGVFSFLETPMTAGSLTSSLISLSQMFATMTKALKTPENYAESTVSELIHNIGVPANIKGYHFLRTAILMCIDNTENLHSITKLLYPNVAKLHNTTPARVERAIRHSIEATWNRGNPDAIHIVFGYRPNNHPKPTNSEFIAMITDNLRVKMNLAR